MPEVIDRDPSLREILPVWIQSKNATGLIPPLDPRAIDAAPKLRLARLLAGTVGGGEKA